MTDTVINLCWVYSGERKKQNKPLPDDAYILVGEQLTDNKMPGNDKH